MGEKKKSLKFKGNNLYLSVGQYRNNGNLAIQAYTDEEPYGDITINLTGMSIDGDEGFINSITKDSGLANRLIKVGIIKEIICTTRYNYGKYDLASSDMEKLKEYDPQGVAEYQKSLQEEEFDEELEE